MENLDHDFPLAPRMLLSLSGVVVCKDKNSQQTFHPSAMHAFVRPIRYYPTSATTNMHDLMQTLMDEFGTPTNNTIDVLLVGSDNGPDYSMEVSLVQHILGRIWRERGLAWSALGAHAPYHSAYCSTSRNSFSDTHNHTHALQLTVCLCSYLTSDKA